MCRQNEDVVVMRRCEISEAVVVMVPRTPGDFFEAYECRNCIERRKGLRNRLDRKQGENACEC